MRRLYHKKESYCKTNLKKEELAENPGEPQKLGPMQDEPENGQGPRQAEKAGANKLENLHGPPRFKQ